MIHKNLIFTSILALVVLPSIAVAQPVEIKVDLKAEGWTMVSLPLQLDSMKIDPNCNIIGGVLQYGTAQKKFLEASLEINSLNELSKSGKGFFIANGGGPACSITFKGNPIEFNAPLPKGWNLIAGGTNFASSCVLHFETWYDWTSGIGYKKTNLSALLETGLELGKAYWIYVDNDECKVQNKVTSPSKQLRPHVYILEDDGTLDNNPLWGVTKKFYEKYPDQYDFMVIHYKEGNNKRGPGAGAVQYSIKGNFVAGDVWKDQTSSAGSTKLLWYFEDTFNFNKVYVQRDPDNNPISSVDTLYFRLLFHELTHYWGVTLPDALKEAQFDRAHFESFTGSWVAARPSTREKFIESPEGKYYFRLDCSKEPKHHDFDLYSMGLKSPEEIKEKLIVPAKSGFFPSGKCDTNIEVSPDWIKKTYTIQDFINVLGPRVPSVADAQKDFTIAFVMVVPKGETLTQKQIDALNWIADKFPVTWYKSTEGRSTLNGIKPADTKPPVISNVKTSATKSSITVSWTTNEPATSFVVYTSFTSFIYPVIITNPPKFSTTHNIKIESSDLPPEQRVTLIQPNMEYSIKILSIDKDYNMASYDAGKLKTSS